MHHTLHIPHPSHQHTNTSAHTHIHKHNSYGGTSSHRGVHDMELLHAGVYNVCVCVCVCEYECLRLHLSLYMFVRRFDCLPCRCCAAHLCEHVCICVCTHACVRVCVCVRVRRCKTQQALDQEINSAAKINFVSGVYIYLCACVFVCVCMCVCLC